MVGDGSSKLCLRCMGWVHGMAHTCRLTPLAWDRSTEWHTQATSPPWLGVGPRNGAHRPPHLLGFGWVHGMAHTCRLTPLAWGGSTEWRTQAASPPWLGVGPQDGAHRPPGSWSASIPAKASNINIKVKQPLLEVQLDLTGSDWIWIWSSQPSPPLPTSAYLNGPS